MTDGQTAQTLALDVPRGSASAVPGMLKAGAPALRERVGL